MSNKMLIDAIHPEETRVVVVRDKRVEDFDFEAASKKPLRGNIYLAKVTRVEPSLQAAFVEYGGNRHGFLAFSEIHPDYYQIPQADRAALLSDERSDARSDAREDDEQATRKSRSRKPPRSAKGGGSSAAAPRAADDAAEDAEATGQMAVGTPEDVAAIEATARAATDRDEAVSSTADNGSGPQGSVSTGDGTVSSDDEPAGLDRAIAQVEATIEADVDSAVDNPARDVEVDGESESAREMPQSADQSAEQASGVTPSPAEDEVRSEARGRTVSAQTDAGPGEINAESQSGEPTAGPDAADDAEEKPAPKRRRKPTTAKPRAPRVPRTKKSADGLADPRVSDDEARRHDDGETGEDAGSVTSMGSSDALEEIPERRQRQPLRQYKIQDVIRRRQILLVQVVKEERGTKGAALTTYLSLAGRYSVLMPNTDRGGGVSRKITDNADRKRLKGLVAELDVPEGMGIILRTAGAARTKTEIKRDFEYLLRLWESVRDLTLKSIAPELVYEEGNLVKRSMRDLYNKEIDEILVSGENAYREAKDFMRMLMPSHAKNVKPYREATPIFTSYGVEPQLDAMFSEQVTLPSKGYIVINPTEALVSIDVNSGRSTKESNIEDTALKTNLEAADEVARQLRLRDLAGLIVIDFIDMDEKRNNRTVEKRLKDALKLDRSRIQVGRISPFGLMEMSRQRIRQGMVETSMVPCDTCGGTGHVRSTQSVALHCLRALEEHVLRNSDHHVTLKTSASVAFYILNQKRSHLTELEDRFALEIGVDPDETLSGQHLQIISGAVVERDPAAVPPTAQLAPDAVRIDDDEEAELDAAAMDAEAVETGEAGEQPSGERSGSSRRRRRRRRRGGGGEDTRHEEGRGEDSDDDAASIDGRTGDDHGEGDAEETGSEDEAPLAAAQSENASASGAGEGDGAGNADEIHADGDDERSSRRRRGRRGGRRHRREGEDAGAEETQSGEQGRSAEAGAAGSVASFDETEADRPAADVLDDDVPDDTNGPEAEPQDATEPSASFQAQDDPTGDRENGSATVAATAEDGPAPERKSEPPRERRSGWWQRRSFF